MGHVKSLPRAFRAPDCEAPRDDLRGILMLYDESGRTTTSKVNSIAIALMEQADAPPRFELGLFGFKSDVFTCWTSGAEALVRYPEFESGTFSS